MFKSRLGRIFRSGTFYAWVLFVAGVSLSALGAHLLFHQIEKNAKNEFQRLSERTELEVAKRLENVVRALRGARGLYLSANQAVTRENFRKYVSSLEIESDFTGVRGFGFFQRVDRADLPAFIAAEKADGVPEFAVAELVDKDKQDLFVVKFIEPLPQNLDALGVDLGSEAIRRSGIQQAINTGAPTVTGAISLRQDTKTVPGFLLFVPVYRYGAAIAVPRERRDALIGVLYAPIALAELLQGMPDVQSGMLDFEIVDAPINSASGPLLYDADPSVGLPTAGIDRVSSSRYSLRKPMQLPGRSVTLSMQSTPTFDTSFNFSFPWLLFGCGVAISALLATTTRQLLTGRVRAERLAQAMTLDLNAEIEERKALAESLALARDQALEASRLKSSFMANMSHELRTPMNAILGMLDLLQSTELTSRQLDYATKTENAAKTLLALLNGVLDFSKIEAGKMTLEFAPMQFEEMLRNLSVILSGNIGNKNVEVLFDIDPNLPPVVKGDAMRLQQVLTNLGGNAVKFTSEGHVLLALRRLEQSNESVTVEFSVRDTGIGIAPEHQGHIFSGFSQAEASTTRRFGGTGLGLAISQKFVQLMGGEIQIKSDVGKGSTFSFVLKMPIAEVGAEPIGDLQKTSQRSQHVLVVDDNPVAGELALRMVRSLGWAADLATSGDMALQKVLAQDADGKLAKAYSAIYMDFQLPDMDGWSITQQIRKNAQGRQLKQPLIIMVAANGREMLGHRTTNEQEMLNGFLVKPLTASMFRDAVLNASVGNIGLRLAAKGRSSERQLSGMRILVVEDNLINQQVADELLSAQGAIVSLAANGKIGVEAVAAAAPQFDVVLMDLQMPVLDGYGATQAIREDLGLTQLPIIAMTANAMASDREACIAAGMTDHIGKPFDIGKLVSLLIRTTGLNTSAEPLQAEFVPTTAESGLPLVEGLDLQTAIGRLSGMHDLYARTARDFVNIMDTTIPELQKHLMSGERQKAAMNLHTLKGNAGTLGANELSAEAGKLEKQCANGAELEDLSKALGRLEGLMGSTQLALMQAIAALEPKSGIRKSTSPEPADRIVSKEAIESVRRIASMANSYDMDVLQEFGQNRELLAVLPAESLDSLDLALQDLNFEKVARLCKELLQRYDN